MVVEEVASPLPPLPKPFGQATNGSKRTSSHLPMVMRRTENTKDSKLWTTSKRSGKESDDKAGQRRPRGAR